MSAIRVELKKRIRRPLAVVRAQALDMAAHIRRNVHHDIKYLILRENPEGCRVRAETRLLGMKQIDEIELRAHEDGTVSQTYVQGSNQGLRVVFRFEEGWGAVTWVLVTAEAPVEGWRRLLKPLLGRAVRNLGEMALEEDRADLEEGNYQPTSVMTKAA
jgi:hypothetical protein